MGSIPSNRQIHARVDVGRPDGFTWEDITSYTRALSIECGSIEQIGTQASGADGAIRRLSFTLQNEGANRFSLLDQNSLLNQHNGEFVPLLASMRTIDVKAATTPVGEQPTQMISLFRGYLGERLDTDGPTVDGSARDLTKRLQNKFIIEKREYGSDEVIVPVEDVIQQILDDNFGVGEITLICPVPTERGVRKYELEGMDVWTALWQLVIPWGGWLGYRCDTVTGNYILTLMHPPRDKGPDNPDFVFDASDIYIESLQTSDDDIRNLVVIEYYDEAAKEVRTITEKDDDSIDAYGERAMKIKSERLKTESEARQMAQAALHDLAGHPAIVRLNLPFVPEMDVFAGILVTNPKISSTQDFYGVVSVRHDFVWDGNRSQFRTEVVAAGRVIGGHRRWQQMETKPGSPPVASPDQPPANVVWGDCTFITDVSLNWQKVDDATAYEIRTSDINWGYSDGIIYRGNSLSHRFTPTQRNYTLYIKAINQAGLYSNQATPITLSLPAPNPPQMPTLTPYFEAIQVTITPVINSAVRGHYAYISIDGGDELKVPAPSLSFAMPVPAGSTMAVQLTAYDIIGEGGRSAVVWATTQEKLDLDVVPPIPKTGLDQSLQQEIDLTRTDVDSAKELAETLQKSTALIVPETTLLVRFDDDLLSVTGQAPERAERVSLVPDGGKHGGGVLVSDGGHLVYDAGLEDKYTVAVYAVAGTWEDFENKTWSELNKE